MVRIDDNIFPKEMLYFQLSEGTRSRDRLTSRFKESSTANIEEYIRKI